MYIYIHILQSVFIFVLIYLKKKSFLKSANVPLTDFRAVVRHIVAIVFPYLPNLLPLNQ